MARRTARARSDQPAAGSAQRSPTGGNCRPVRLADADGQPAGVRAGLRRRERESGGPDDHLLVELVARGGLVVVAEAAGVEADLYEASVQLRWSSISHRSPLNSKPDHAPGLVRHRQVADRLEERQVGAVVQVNLRPDGVRAAWPSTGPPGAVPWYSWPAKPSVG